MESFTDIKDSELEDIQIPMIMQSMIRNVEDSIDNNNKDDNKEEIKVEVDEKNNLYTFECPHCKLFVEVERNQVNCTIFRHGYFFNKVGETIVLTSQMNPHTPKEECDRLVEQGRVYGCGKPFRMIQKEGKYVVVKCGYI